MNKKTLTIDEATALLPDGDDVHTFRNPGVGMLVGADWKRDEIVAAMAAHGVEEAGDQAKAMHHGLVLHDGKGYLFIETRKAET